MFKTRVEPMEREAWATCAEAEGYFSVSDWIRDIANSRARNRPMLSSANDGWNTPPEVLEHVRRMVGKIGLDPCSNASSVVGARTSWDVHADGLPRPWAGHGSVFVNPPYSDALPHWIAKCRNEAAEGVEILALVPARTDTGWFRNVLSSPAEVCLWRGRIRFLGAPHPATFPSAMIYWGPRGDAFRTVFKPIANGFLAGT